MSHVNAILRKPLQRDGFEIHEPTEVSEVDCPGRGAACFPAPEAARLKGKEGNFLPRRRPLFPPFSSCKQKPESKAVVRPAVRRAREEEDPSGWGVRQSPGGCAAGCRLGGSAPGGGPSLLARAFQFSLGLGSRLRLHATGGGESQPASQPASARPPGSLSPGALAPRAGHKGRGLHGPAVRASGGVSQPASPSRRPRSRARRGERKQGSSRLIIPLKEERLGESNIGRIIQRGETVMEYMSMDSDNKDIDLLLTDLNMSEVIDIMENLYPSRDLAGYKDSVLTLCPEMNKNEEHTESLLFSRREVSLLSSVKYGTVEDLLAFANQVSNMAKQICRHRRQESGIILNMITPKNGRYQIDSDVLLFPWKLTYRNIGTDFIPRGAFGKVYLAQDTETKKRMACKLVPVEQFKPSDVEIQACFRHENIAELYGAILWDETIHLFMEAGEGGSVLEKVESCGPMRTFEIIWVTKHILKGLEFLHSKRVIHQDIKPSNIVFMSTKAVLVDFGLSVQMTEDVYYPKELRGTEIYMSPEVILCRGHTTKADIYSLGATIIHMQTGIPPWVNRYPRAAYPSYLYIIHKQAPPLEDISEDCSTSMRTFLESALERNPNQRPSATELLKHVALHPPREEQPRCQSLDSALFEQKRLLSQKELELPENIADSSSFAITEESELLKRQRSLYIDLGALAGYFNMV